MLVALNKNVNVSPFITAFAAAMCFVWKSLPKNVNQHRHGNGEEMEMGMGDLLCSNLKCGFKCLHKLQPPKSQYHYTPIVVFLVVMNLFDSTPQHPRHGL